MNLWSPLRIVRTIPAHQPHSFAHWTYSSYQPSAPETTPALPCRRSQFIYAADRFAIFINSASFISNISFWVSIVSATGRASLQDAWIQ